MIVMKIDINKLKQPPVEDFSGLTFGDKLRAVREAKGLSQKELSERIGVTPNYISNYERNINQPNLQMLEWICKALDITTTELLGF